MSFPLLVGATPLLGEELQTFLPAPEAIFIQKLASPTEKGNVKIFVQIDDAGIEVLAKQTGRSDFIVLGASGDQTILRDDGNWPDISKGDGEFTGLASIDDDELTDRADEDAANTHPQRGATKVTFEGRVRKGESSAQPFDVGGFKAGAKVSFDLPVVTIGPSGLSQVPVQPLAGTPWPELLPAHKPIETSPAAVVTPGTNPFQDQVLMITDPSVVTDPTRTFDACTNTGAPNGVWTFGHLITEMANQSASGIAPSDLAEQWLNHWASTQVVNTFNVPPRAAMAQLISDWRAASGGGALDLTIAPLRLLAIVSRLDLRKSTGTGGGGYPTSAGGDKFLDAGEARFVFGVLLPPGYSSAPFFGPGIVNLGGGCRAVAFSVIFEYGVPKCKCEDVRSWARSWVRLSTLPFPSATYNQALEKLTEQFAKTNANPLKPNGSALNQLRTNEIGLQFPWELREFRLLQIPFDFLHETTVADTPSNTPLGSSTDFNNTVTFSNYVLTGPRPVPLLFGGINFLAGSSQVPGGPPPSFHWNGPAPLNANVDPLHSNERFAVGLAACNGCHARETDTVFVHVDPATAGLPATLSGFLTGTTVNDPVYVGAGAPIQREFDDLERREKDIKGLARISCFKFHPIHLDHVLTSLAAQKSLPADLFEGMDPVPVKAQGALALDDFLAPVTSQTH
jgi:hypothetical protein